MHFSKNRLVNKRKHFVRDFITFILTQSSPVGLFQFLCIRISGKDTVGETIIMPLHIMSTTCELTLCGEAL